MKAKRGFGLIAASVVLASVVASPALADPTVTLEQPEEGATISRSTTPTLTITGSAAFDAPQQTVRQFFLRRAACGGTADQNPHLSIKSGTDGGNNCGYIPPGWNALSEVFGALGEGEALAVTYPAVDGIPLTYDASQPITGKIVVQSYGGATGGGAGQSRAEITVTGDAQGTLEEVGKTTVEYLVMPNQGRYEIDFSIAPKAGLDRKDYTGIQLKLNLKGPAVLHGYVGLNGQSFVNVPVYTASFARAVQIAIDNGQFSSTGVTLNTDGTWTATRPTPAVGAHTIRARAAQGGIFSDPVVRNITVTS